MSVFLGMEKYRTVRVSEATHERLKAMALHLAIEHGIAPTLSAALRWSIACAEEQRRADERRAEQLGGGS